MFRIMTTKTDLLLAMFHVSPIRFGTRETYMWLCGVLFQIEMD